MMGKTARVSLRDLRSIYLLLGECSELAHLPEIWCRHLHEGLVGLLHSYVTTFVFASAESVQNLLPPSPGDISIGFGWSSESARQKAWDFYRSGGFDDDPVIGPWSRTPGARVVRIRQELADDRAWYASESYNNCHRICDTDNLMLSRCALPGDRGMFMSVWRAVGEPPFTRREAQLVRIVHREIARLRGRELVSAQYAAVASLGPRARQVLSLLLEGMSEKQVSRALGISQHSVHDHVKLLHRRLGVSSRAELMAFIHGTNGHPTGPCSATHGSSGLR